MFTYVVINCEILIANSNQNGEYKRLQQDLRWEGKCLDASWNVTTEKDLPEGFL